MKTSRLRIFLIFIAGAVLLSGCGQAVEQDGSEYQADGKDGLLKEVIYSSEDRNEKRDGEFPAAVEVDGKKYTLEDIRYEVTDQEEKMMESVRILTSGLIPEGAEYKPEENLEVDGITYQLESVEKKEDGTVEETSEQAVTSYTDYDTPVTAVDVPQTKTVQAVNEKTGETETVVCSLAGVTQTGGGIWTDSYIDITYISYDADTFVWGDAVVSKEDAPYLNERSLLESAGMDPVVSRVKDIYWTGAEYLDAGGVLCRDARADVEQYTDRYRASYTGTIRQEEVKGTVYEAVYSGERPQEDAFFYEITATAEYRRDQSTAYIVLAGAGILVLACLAAALLFLTAKRRKEKEVV